MRYSLIVLIFFTHITFAKPVDISLSQKDVNTLNGYASAADKIALQSKKVNQVHAPDLTVEDAACQLAKQGMHDIINEKIPTSTPGKAAQVYIFVSFSMPETSLQQLLHQASKIDAAIVVRGMYKNSMQATMQKVAKLIAEKNVGGLGIDPVSFTRFNITRVPAVVITNKAESSNPNQTPTYAVIFGNASLHLSLEKLSASPRYGKYAAEYLQQLRGKHD